MREVFEISVGTTHARMTEVVDLPAARASGLLCVLREADSEFVLLDGTLAECERAAYSVRRRRHEVNVQVIGAWTAWTTVLVRRVDHLARRRSRQNLSWAKARSPGALGRAWSRLNRW